MKKKFDFSTIENFDKHISDSIAGYELLDELIMNICSFYAKNGCGIIDLGCTSGRLIDKLGRAYTQNVCLGYDITGNNFKDTFVNVSLIKQDITDSNFEMPSANIILSVFTLQFLTISGRLGVLKKVFKALNPNGVFIICEKELSSVGTFQEVFTFANYDYKKSKFSAEEILEKERDLRSIMNCLSTGENETMLRDIGFTRVEPFFQSLNFKGWLCMK